ncbi:MAG: rhodanese-like domain-containing protein [Thermodesulfobacteriota bacterium]
MEKFKPIIMLTALALVLSPAFIPREAQGMEPVVQKNCLGCHQDFSKMENILAGNLSSKVLKAMILELDINNRKEMVKFTKETETKNISDLKNLEDAVALRVHYQIVGNDRVATKIVVKPEMNVPENQLISVNDLAKLIAQGPEKGGYTLVDSRPTPGYQKGHLPTAISIPFPKMKEMAEKVLPQEKDRLVIFYCEGYR